MAEAGLRPRALSDVAAPRREQLRHFRGCFLGGAVGDALGAAVEFMDMDEILRAFGPEGIRDPARAALPVEPA